MEKKAIKKIVEIAVGTKISRVPVSMEIAHIKRILQTMSRAARSLKERRGENGQNSGYSYYYSECSNNSVGA